MQGPTHRAAFCGKLTCQDVEYLAAVSGKIFFFTWGFWEEVEGK